MSEFLSYYPVLLNPWVVAILLNTVLIGGASPFLKKLLTPAGIFHAWILGVLIWGSLNWPGYLVVVFYFLVGSGVTRIGMAEKEVAGIAEKRKGARGPENVWGSALTATVCALGVANAQKPGFLIKFLVENINFHSNPVSLSEAMPQSESLTGIAALLMLGYVASFSTKLADTCASEVGKVYGQRTFLITTLQPVPRGTEGAVSLEGTLAGIVGSGAIALVGWAVGLINLPGIFLCMIAAFIATNLESVIGATLQSRYTWLTNEVVNIINTTIGAIAVILLALVLPF
jgi:uncharacterized membrane protein